MAEAVPCFFTEEKQIMKRFLKVIIIVLIIISLVVWGMIAGQYFFKDGFLFHRYDNSQKEEQREIPDTDTSGFIYCSSSEENIVEDKEQGLLYVNNEILVTLESEDDRGKLVDYLNPLDGSIVGEIPEVADYQVLLKKEYSLDELNQIILDLEKQDWVKSAMPNYAIKSDAQYIPNDSKWKRKWGKIPEGKNWGAEAIKSEQAWDYKDDMTNTVNIGFIDDMFDADHEDLTFSEMPFGSIAVDQKISEGKLKWSDHGTHTSGIAAADFDNGKGIAGISINQNLYGVAMKGLEAYEYDTVQNWKIAFYYLIAEKKCKVVNCSLGYDQYTFEASRGGKTATEELQAWSDGISDFLEALIDMDYEFVICKSAGNQNKVGGNYQYFKKDDGDTSTSLDYYSYAEYLNYLRGERNEDNAYFERYVNRRNEIEAKLESGNVKAKYDIFGMIQDEKVKSRILIVGAAENAGYHREGFLGIFGKKVHDGYKIADFSQYGGRVDIIAPGVDIYSTISGGYGMMSGTSMSAPMVSGAAALLWSIDPDLRAADVCKLLCKSGTKIVGLGETGYTGYPMLNIGESVKKLTGWNNTVNIQEGLYIVPDTQNILYVEQDEDEIVFNALWINLTSIEEIAALKGSNAEFVHDEGSTEQISGTLHFDTNKAILTLDENRSPYIDEQTEYIWLRDSMWELSEEQLQEIGKNLNVPENLEVEYTQDDAYYWEAGERYTTYVQISYENKVIAAATVDSFTAELIRDMVMYSESTLQSSNKNVPTDAIEKYGHFYYIFDITDVTDGQAAIDFCKNRGGYLAAITSEEENEFVFHYMMESGYRNAYFGFSDFDEEGKWKWVNDEPVSFTNWHDGEPNGGSSENYAMFYEKYPDGTWNDGGCANRSGEVFICEWE